MAPRLWPDKDEYADVMLVVAGDMTKTAFMKKHHRAKATLYRWIDDLEAGTLEIKGDDVVPRAVPQSNIPDEVLENVDFDNGVWLALENLQHEIGKLETEQFEATINLDDEEPILVVWLSDLHIGHRNCQMKQLRSDLEKIKATPGAYVILGGDLIDNVTTGVAGRGMFHEQLTSIEYQKYLTEEFIKYLGSNRVLAMILGNHEAFSMRSDDFNPIKYLAKKTGAPYLGVFGYLNLRLGAEDYKLLCAHQFRLGSSFNKTHSAKRLMDFTGDADVVFTGHRHDASVETTRVRQINRFFAQAGTYLKSSTYGKQLGFSDATIEMPGVILYPNRRKIVGVYNAIEEGIDILNLLRGKRVNAA